MNSNRRLAQDDQIIMASKKRRKKLKFEECIKTIDVEINKRKNKWSLTSLAWMDFEDVSQIIRIHIFKKWSLYDQTKPLGPWLNRIISNQIKNFHRYCHDRMDTKTNV